MAYLNAKSRDRARALRKDDTEAERKLWEAIRSRRLAGFKFVRQLAVGPCFADFACRECKLIVEIDGATHGSDVEMRYDERRTAFLQGLGFRVLRFWNDDVYKGMPEVCDAILLALGEEK